MPLKPSYLLLLGAGGIVAYSGFKGLSISSAARSVISGNSPQAAQTANAILTASYTGYGAGGTGGGGSGGGGGGGGGASGNMPGSKPIGNRGSTGTGTASPLSNIGGKAGSGSLSAAAAKALGFAMVTAAGWGSQWNDFNNVVMAESGWRWNATNPTSGAYGIPQSLPAGKMASAGSDWRTSSRTQIKWMIGYIRASYGDPAHAWAHEQSHHWY